MATETAKDSAQVQIDLLQYSSGEANCVFKGEHSLYISLASRPVHYSHTQDGKTHTSLYQRGEMLITPADTPLFARWEGKENCLQIRLNDEFMRNVARETVVGDCDRITLKPEFQARNPQLESIGTMLFNEFQQGSLSNRLYVDSLSNILAVNLLRQHATTRPHLPTYEGGLPPRQLRQILDYIDAHLDQEIKLADLAQLLDMSQFHFSRLFKQSLGISPYQYLLQQRVERAKQLLKTTDRFITDIALTCGFNSHSHLSKQFRQLTGMTPKAYRSS
ncbi:helix-turn-helix domain-containing protein [filamentous cyanobacterium LEGE 11480]|uniref:Helix-turn-helix domain-containing protein n=1 Tax=Romeriopsis navalis LEGE 11480 TaxID=2777977 RepID=A0A928VNU6_9CYAN|nr:helix-turn-helix domain-containing protein [Romeriopsis navalis]MBE9031032.1 helix-turn-helix domain-containing protein [Romeriopsis navalis LEGE 11480]